MLYVLEPSSPVVPRSMSFRSAMEGAAAFIGDDLHDADEYDQGDIDFVDDTLLNTAPHNPIERQLFTGDVVGLALMSSAILWSAMGAFG